MQKEGNLLQGVVKSAMSAEMVNLDGRTQSKGLSLMYNDQCP